MQNKSHPFLTRLKHVQKDESCGENIYNKKTSSREFPLSLLKLHLDSKKMINCNSFQNLYVDTQIIAFTLQAIRKKIEHKSKDYYMYED